MSVLGTNTIELMRGRGGGGRRERERIPRIGPKLPSYPKTGQNIMHFDYQHVTLSPVWLPQLYILYVVLATTTSTY